MSRDVAAQGAASGRYRIGAPVLAQPAPADSETFLYEGRPIGFRPGQSVREALQAAGETVHASCRVGACQNCLLLCLSGDPGAQAQAGLAAEHRALGLFKPCVSLAKESLRLSSGDQARQEVEAEVIEHDWLSDSIVRLRLRPLAPFAFKPGQVVNVSRDGMSRPYSIASTPRLGSLIELHVRVVSGGRMSERIAHHAAPGDRFTLRGPSGDCVYEGVDRDAALILAGAGTGLAPLWGLLHCALAKGHRGPIRLLHGAGNRAGLYLVDELYAMARHNPQITYQPCVRSDPTMSGDLEEALIQGATPLDQADIFLCGHAGLVKGLERTALARGAQRSRVRTTGFVRTHCLDRPSA